MKNTEFYTRVRDTQPQKEKPRSKINWSQTLLILALIIFFFPLYPGRRGQRDFPTGWSDYVERAGIALFVVAAIGIVVFWIRVVKPFLDRKYRYKYEGTFDVTDKIKTPKKRLKLHPGTDHLVSVDSDFFNEVTVGDKVYVERKISGEIILVRRVIE